MRTTHALRRFAGQPYVQRGWSTSRVLLMLAVDEAGSLRMGEVRDRLGVTGRSITSLVDGLEDEGLLSRHTDPDDRRSIRLEITAKGHEHLGEIKTLHATHADRTFAILSEADRTNLLNILDQLREHVASQQGSHDR